MRHFFKRVNRGILLGVILLIGLTVFIWQDETVFQKEIPSIESTTAAYMEGIGKINTSGKDFQKIGATMTKEQQKAKLTEFTDFINRYWIESESKNAISKSTLIEQIKGMMEKDSGGNGYIQKFTVKQNGQPKVSKTGPGSADINAEYTFVIEFAGCPTLFLGDYIYPIDNLFNYGKDSSSTEKVDPTRKRFTLNTQLTVSLEKVGGSWKICAASGGFNSSGEPVDIE
ncbi:MAG: hypothetical protein GX424_07205 [Clostridiales bacterium]|jgi:hypothetical protein|nr:hypothetical protein [Clostridiales bacterium]